MKSNGFVDLEVVPNLEADDVMELERHEQAMLIYSLHSTLIC